MPTLRFILLTGSILAAIPIYGIVSQSQLIFAQEELINGFTFKQQMEIVNGQKQEKYFVNQKAVTAREYEEAIEQAEKEELKQERKRQQDERLKQYETQYKGHAKLAQIELKKTLSQAQAALSKLVDPRLEKFLIYAPDTIADQKQLATIKDTILPEAIKLSLAAPETVDIKKIKNAHEEIAALTIRLRAASSCYNT